MTGSAEELVARLGPRRAAPAGAPPSPRRPALGKLGGASRLAVLVAVGSAISLAALIDRPQTRSTPPAAQAEGDRFTLAADLLPATVDGRPLTYGDLFDLYGLEDERLRRSLEATFQRRFSLEEARRYRQAPIGRRSIVIVLRGDG